MIQTDFLVYQAKSFYNAYIALEQINTGNDNQLLYCVPIIVNGAFSIEITIKAILAKNSIEYGKEHNLYVLFKLLPEPFQNELLDYLIRKAPEYADTKKCFDEMVLLSNAFTDWRYCFEGNPAPALESRFLAAFANAAICTMFSHYNVDFVRANSKEKTIEEVDAMIQENREQHINENLRIINKKLGKSDVNR